MSTKRPVACRPKKPARRKAPPRKAEPRQRVAVEPSIKFLGRFVPSFWP